MAFDLRRLLGMEAPQQQKPAPHAATKVPFDNGFYAGPHQPSVPFAGGFAAHDPAQLQTQPGNAPANLGVGYADVPQMQSFNPGFTPLQGSTGRGAYPQVEAFGGVQRPGDQFNPQDDENQQYWY